MDIEINKKNDQDKAGCLTGGGHSVGNHSDMDLLVIGQDEKNNPPLGKKDDSRGFILINDDAENKARVDLFAVGLREVRSDEAKQIRKENAKKGIDYNRYRAKNYVMRPDGKTGALLTALTGDNLILISETDIGRKNKIIDDGKYPPLRSHAGNSHDNKVIQLNKSLESHNQQPYQQNRVYSEDGKSPALAADLSPPGNNIYNGIRIRRITEIECERLQTVPDNYTAGVSSTQRYKMLGNGWTIDVIAYIFSFINKG